MSRLLAGPPLTRTDTRVDFEVLVDHRDAGRHRPRRARTQRCPNWTTNSPGIDATCSRFRADSEINRVLASTRP